MMTDEDILFETPVLFLIFNRPDVTKKVFGQIQKIKPKQLFIAADGPRDSHPDDKTKCETTRKLVLKMIDWECDVKTLFREENLGCGLAVSQAITWFFEHVEMGIILEDDCYADLSFFGFCRELLEYYKEDEEVMHISGGSYLPAKSFKNESYYYSKYAYVWGWGTWKTSWRKFNFNIEGLSNYIDDVHSKEEEKKYWHRIYNSIQKKEIDTWAWRWNFNLWKFGGLSVNSTVNRIKNIGFSDGATHTRSSPWMYDRIPLTNEDNMKIVHPKKRTMHEKADYLVFYYYNLRKIPFRQKIKDRIYGRLQSIFVGKKKC